MSKALERLRELDRREHEAAKQTPPNTPPPTAEGGKSLSIRTASTDEAAEIETMQDAFDLLGMIRADTGESGHASGDYIEFHHCPICHHRDDFRYYPATNSACCYGGSNPNANADGRDGGRALWYLRRTGKATSNTEAVKLLREATGHAYEGKPKTKPDRGEALSWDDEGEATEEAKPDDENQKPSPLPIISTDNLTGANKLETPPDLIGGIMSKGSIMMLAAPSKKGKSWASLGLAWALCSGGLWMDFFPCRRSRVLYVNVELQLEWFSDRLDVTKRKGGYEGERFDTLTLRGDEFMAIRDLRASLVAHYREAYDVLIVDPIYLFEEGPENDAETMIALMKEVSAATSTLGCSTVFVHHFAKGNPSAKEPMDRPSGSGVLGRFYDEAVILTPREPDTKSPEYAQLVEAYGERFRAFEFETSSRNHDEDGLESVIWSWPFFHADTDSLTDSWPLVGSTEAGRLRGQATNGDRYEAARNKKDSATEAAIRACRDAGKPPTRPNVYARLGKCCEREGIDTPSEDTFKRSWTGVRGCTHYRSDPERGNELHAIDLEAVTEDNPKPWLPAPDDE